MPVSRQRRSGNTEPRSRVAVGPAGQPKSTTSKDVDSPVVPPSSATSVSCSPNVSNGNSTAARPSTQVSMVIRFPRPVDDERATGSSYDEIALPYSSTADTSTMPGSSIDSTGPSTSTRNSSNVPAVIANTGEL